jgi:hypothetical protein
LDKKATVSKNEKAPKAPEPERVAELMTKALSATPRIVENYSAALESSKDKVG